MKNGKKLGLILPGGGFHRPFQAMVLKFFAEKESGLITSLLYPSGH
jgi:predicted patatin/cPLA2 family phospholipase